MKNVHLFLGVALAMIAADNGHCGVRKGNQFVSVNGGIVIPSLNSKVIGIDVEVGEKGPDFGVSYLCHLTPNLGIGADLDYFSSGEKTLEHYPSPTRDTKSVSRVISYEAAARWLFLPERTWHPFVSIGLGGANVRDEARYAMLNSFESPQFTLYRKSLNGVSASVGTGLEYEISNSILVGFSVKWRYLGANETFDSAGSDGAIYPVEISAGSLLRFGASVSYKFGGK